MQIIKIERKDIIDSFVLLLDKELGDTDKDQINYNYIAQLLSKDWGFYYTVVNNLKKIDNELESYSDFNQNEKEIINIVIPFFLCSYFCSHLPLYTFWFFFNNLDEVINFCFDNLFFIRGLRKKTDNFKEKE